MKKPWKITLICLACAAVLAAAGFICYLVFVQDADLCVVEERQLKKSESDWLIGYFTEGKSTGFYHLCNVRNTGDLSFSGQQSKTVVTAEGKVDASGDDLTTCFLAETGDCTVRIMPSYIMPQKAVELGFREELLNGRPVCIRDDGAALIGIVPLIYTDACAALVVEGNGETDPQQRLNVCASAVEAICPDEHLLIGTATENGVSKYVYLGMVKEDKDHTVSVTDNGDGNGYTCGYIINCPDGITAYVYPVTGTEEIYADGSFEMITAGKGKELNLGYISGTETVKYLAVPSKDNTVCIGITLEVPPQKENTVKQTEEKPESDPYENIPKELLDLYTEDEKPAGDAKAAQEVPETGDISGEQVVLSTVGIPFSTSENPMKAIAVSPKHVEGAKSTWLIAKTGDGKYLKIADVDIGTDPLGFNQDKNADDVDNDSATTQFIYNQRGGDAVMSVYGVSITEDELRKEGFRETVIRYIPGDSKKNNRKTYDPISGLVGAENETGDILFMMESPYDNVFICVRMHRGEGNDALVLTSALFSVANKVTPGKKLHPLIADFKLNFIDDSRWNYLWTGLGMTLLITITSGCMGIVIGAVVAAVRSTWQKNRDNMRPGIGKSVLCVADKICNVYLTVIRGTPVVVQLLIMYLIIFASSSNGTLAAIVAFGINSGAYVAEIIRGGIMSIDNGQFEAGRSLGFNYVQTMFHIILPQVFKNILPTLANEFIALLKETSVAGYVAIRDLTKGGDIIRSVTYSPFLPLLAVAGIYLALVMFFTWLVGRLERRLRNSDH